MTFDSRADTLKHSQRVGELMIQLAHELLDRATRHDRSKTEPPEVVTFNEFTPRLADLTYGSDEYRECLKAMGPALEHHYAMNRHHPEHFAEGINDMTLVDLLEMLADWKAASERHTDGSLDASLPIQQKRFRIDSQLMGILHNSASRAGWLRNPGYCNTAGRAANGERLKCNVFADQCGNPGSVHCDGLMDNLCWSDGEPGGAGKGGWYSAGTLGARDTE